MTNSVQVSGILFSLEPVRSPGRYVSATFINPSEVQILRCEGKQIHFRITKEIEVEDNVSMKEIANSIISSSSNVLWNFEVMYKVSVPKFAPSF